MSFHTPIPNPSEETLVLARWSIVLAVIVTVFISTLIVQVRSRDHQINTDQIPLAHLDVWRELGR